jgi:hypothetical protein
MACSAVGIAQALRLETLIELAHYGMGDYGAAVPYLKNAAVGEPGNLPVPESLVRMKRQNKLPLRYTNSSLAQNFGQTAGLSIGRLLSFQNLFDS